MINLKTSINAAFTQQYECSLMAFSPDRIDSSLSYDMAWRNVQFVQQRESYIYIYMYICIYIYSWMSTPIEAVHLKPIKNSETASNP
jgi:hypothetical protein